MPHTKCPECDLIFSPNETMLKELQKSDEYHEIEKSKLREVIKTLRAENARYREALEFIAEGKIAASSIKHDYIDQAYQEIAREALKGE